MARGRVLSVIGPVVEASLPEARVGDGCRFNGGKEGEVVGFRQGLARILVLGPAAGLGPGTEVRACGRPGLLVGEALLGRV
ncbi:MAG: EscN/YscN/HrcN family type III secretion system ATPase, partial [Myxococcota bacterium]